MNTAVDLAARAIAAVEGDPDQLVEVSTRGGLTRVPIWQLYRVRARKALEAARDILCEAVAEELARDGTYADAKALRDGFDQAVAP